MTNNQNNDVSNRELLSFLKENVATKDDLKNNLDGIRNDLSESEKRIKQTLDAHTQSLDGISKDVQDIKREIVFDRKRISRVEFRTEKLLGKKLTTTDADFEEKYRGEQQLNKQETGG